MSDKLPRPRIVKDTLDTWSPGATVYFLAVIPCRTNKEAKAVIRLVKKMGLT